MAEFVLDDTAQEAFAKLSGDRNPMHMDTLAARRTQAGDRTVHGVHTALRALEILAEQKFFSSSITRIRAKFMKWIYVGDVATLRVEKKHLDPQRIDLYVKDVLTLSLEIVYGVCEIGANAQILKPLPDEPRLYARKLTLDEVVACKDVVYTAKPDNAAMLFPHLATKLGAETIAEIAACSYIVGMEVPGLYSINSKMDLRLLDISGTSQPQAGLQYEVASVDPRFSKVRIAVNGRAIEGTLEAFVRNPPAEQPRMEEVASLVHKGEFAGMHAFVVGGSRGLGELTAKTIASGGGRVTITYARGKADADEVVSQIRAWGAEAAHIPYDVCRPAMPQLVQGEPYTHVFYFATSSIFRPTGALFSASAFATFTEFYLQGFYDLCVALRASQKGQGKLIVYYPSSVAVEERPAGMTEYAMAKAAGEQLCRDMSQNIPGLQILVSRLPRLRTDQTASVIPQKKEDAVNVFLPLLREMQKISLAQD
jgi:hypothetical protein